MGVFIDADGGGVWIGCDRISDVRRNSVNSARTSTALCWLCVLVLVYRALVNSSCVSLTLLGGGGACVGGGYAPPRHCVGCVFCVGLSCNWLI